MKKHWICLACFLAITATMPLRSQTDGENLVFNPSFEEHRKCPMKIDALGVMTEADAWWQPTSGSSDYFNACGSRECNVPHNKMGFQEAHGGNAYCGIYCSQELYREYLQTELKEPLVAGKRYRVSFWVSLADKSPFAVATLGAMLTPQRLEDSTHGILMEREMTTLDGSNTQSIATHFEPQVLNSMDNILDNTKEWVEVSGEFIANGGERFLTIGNFLPFNKSSVVGMEGANLPLSGAYYYIDDVSVVCLDTEKPIIPQTSQTPKAGEVITLKNLYFALKNAIGVQVCESYYTEGNTAFNNKQYDDATAYLEAAVFFDPTNVDALYLLATTYRAAEKNEEAKDAYNKIVELFPETWYASKAEGYINELSD